jgi:hypothetical protein
MSNYIKAPETQVYQPSGSQVVTATTVGPKTALDVNVLAGGGGGGGDTIITDDAAQRLALQDVAGVKKIPVIADVILTPSDDGVHIGSKTTGNLLEPNSDGSINIKASVIENLLTEIQGLNQVMHSLIINLQRSQPQLDVNNRPMVRLNAIDSNLTLTALTNLNNFSGGNTSGLPYQLSNSFHIYNNITVTP